MQSGNDLEKQREARLSAKWPHVYRFIYYKVQNREEAEELTQETFQRVFRQSGRGGIREEEKLEGYLFTAARNIVTDLWRKRGRQARTLSLEDLQAKGWDPPQRKQQEVEERLMVQEALKQLNADYQRVLTYRIIEGRPVNEVARKMKRSPGAVRSLQLRALQALKEILAEGGYFHD